MNILFIGDIVGKAGRKITAKKIFDLVDQYSIEFVIANIENAAAGFGITPKIADDLLSLNIDCLTSGNHIFDRKEIVPYLSKQAKLLRPLNYPEPAPGSGIFIGTAKNGARVAVLNVMGRVFINSLNCPFTSTDEALKMIRGKSDVIIVDLKMPKENGIKTVSEIHRRYPGSDIVVMSSILPFKEAISNSVYSYLKKPVHLDELELILARISERHEGVDINIHPVTNRIHF